MSLVPMLPTIAAPLFPQLGDRLIMLLRGLEPDDWHRATVCADWSVRDIATHLLDSALRRLSFERDGHPPGSGSAPEDYAGLVELLNELNAQWVTAAKRLSPQVLTDLLEFIEPQLAAHLESLDPQAKATFAVDWAGESESEIWFDVARELTERWHHQQQIRLAVAAPPLVEPHLSEPVFDTFVRALPHRYREVEAAAGTALALEIRGEQSYRYVLEHQAGAWQLFKGSIGNPETVVAVDEEPAWLMFSKGINGAEARERAEILGDSSLAEPFFGILGVMA